MSTTMAYFVPMTPYCAYMCILGWKKSFGAFHFLCNKNSLHKVQNMVVLRIIYQESIAKLQQTNFINSRTHLMDKSPTSWTSKVFQQPITRQKQILIQQVGKFELQVIHSFLMFRKIIFRYIRYYLITYTLTDLRSQHVAKCGKARGFDHNLKRAKK
jgi:hypothetical protein